MEAKEVGMPLRLSGTVAYASYACHAPLHALWAVCSACLLPSQICQHFDRLVPCDKLVVVRVLYRRWEFLGRHVDQRQQGGGLPAW